MDPPRKSVALALINAAVDMMPDCSVYVSCDSATLVRDLGFFQEKDYEVVKGAVVDMFPLTSHCERKQNG